MNPYRSRILNGRGPAIIDGRVQDARATRLRQPHYGMDGKIIAGEDQLTGGRLSVPQERGTSGMRWLDEQANLRAKASMARTKTPDFNATPKTADISQPITMNMEDGQPKDGLTLKQNDPLSAVKQRAASVAVAPRPQASGNTTVTALPNGGYRTSANPDYRNNASDGITPYGLIGKTAEVANRASAGVAQRTADQARRADFAKTIGAKDVTGMDSAQAAAAVGGGANNNFEDANDPEAYRRRMRAGGMPKMPAVTPQGRRMAFSAAF